MKKLLMMSCLLMGTAVFAEDTCKQACDHAMKEGNKICKEKTGGRPDIVKKCLDALKPVEKTCVEDCRKRN